MSNGNKNQGTPAPAPSPPVAPKTADKPKDKPSGGGHSKPGAGFGG